MLSHQPPPPHTQIHETTVGRCAPDCLGAMQGPLILQQGKMQVGGHVGLKQQKKVCVQSGTFQTNQVLFWA